MYFPADTKKGEINEDKDLGDINFNDPNRENWVRKRTFHKNKIP